MVCGLFSKWHPNGLVVYTNYRMSINHLSRDVKFVSSPAYPSRSRTSTFTTFFGVFPSSISNAL